MGHKIKLEVSGYSDFSVEISNASVVLDDYYSQCWCVGLKVHWQTASIDGWGFLSKRWGELLFEKIPECPPPHFISGVAIQTKNDNDMLWEFAEDVGANPQDLAVAIFETLGNVMFVLSPLRLIGSEVKIDSAMSYRHVDMIHRISIV